MSAEQQAQKLISALTTWLRHGILVVLLLAVAVTLLKLFGVRLTFMATPGHVELAYLAGVYWLTKG
jgi:cell division protein FtsX